LTCIHTAFTQFQELAVLIPINGIGGHSILATRKGQVELPVLIGDGIAWLKLRNILYALKLGHNLVSTGTLLKAGLQVSMTTNGATILSQNTPDQPLAHASFVECLWILNVESLIMRTLAAPAANIATMGTTWHKHLNHVGINALRDLASGGAIPLLTKSNLHAIQNCSTCVLGKGVQLPFPSSLMQLASKPLELIHSDLVCGLDTSIGDAQYTAMFIDDCMHMAWVFPLKHKHELAQTFLQLHTKLELQTEHCVKVFHTDGGGEYMSDYLTSYLADASIAHQTTCVNSLQSNGVVEHFQHTLFDYTWCNAGGSGNDIWLVGGGGCDGSTCLQPYTEYSATESCFPNVSLVQ
jgi:hypothetical protein